MFYQWDFSGRLQGEREEEKDIASLFLSHVGEFALGELMSLYFHVILPLVVTTQDARIFMS